ncbi:hypothetical protein [Aquisphaera giovannonii]|nr:hypothetical protein [Aquisphaera giovannonii]
MFGLLTAPTAVAAIGASCGLVHGWAHCHAFPFTACGARFGAVADGYLSGLPAAVFGPALGALSAKGTRGMTLALLKAAAASSASPSRSFVPPAGADPAAESIPTG